MNYSACVMIMQNRLQRKLMIAKNRPKTYVFPINVNGRVAQSVEQRTENPCVASSILAPAIFF